MKDNYKKMLLITFSEVKLIKKYRIIDNLQKYTKI